ncbi:ABC transporter ATP-binding protein [Romboutsia lituseburensis]|uniref:ABC transporter ATP-binding protein n=1 Tax=Romboutsia lituseburensis TaxID=1537 RepID=UPI0022EB0EF6|nr:ABC transporter ATP-binding protein [Romboutsia lituseburensis]
MSEVLKVENLTKKRGNKIVVDNLSFTINKGDIFGFLGPNGAGKTTTLKMILKLIKKDSGKVYIDGFDIDTNFKDAIKNVSAIIENPAIYLDLTAYENLKIVKNFSDSYSVSYEIEDVLEIVGLNGREYEKVKKYSLGMKQRLSIAMALIKNPKIILLDEPTNGLDPKGIIEMRELIKELCQKHNKTIIISSHILHEIEMMCNRVVIINKGKQILESDIESITNKNDLFFIRTSDINKSIKVLNDKKYATLHKIQHKGITVQSNESSIALLAKEFMKNDIYIYEISSNNKSLEDIFIEITGGK